MDMPDWIIDFLINAIIQIIHALGYYGIFGLMLVESAGLPIPSELIMPFGGFLVAEGNMNFWIVSVLGTFGNLVGSLIAYWIGLRGGRPLIEKYGKYILISKHDLDIADRWFAKHGDWAAFFGRLLPVIRTYISFPAGIAKMDIKKFAIYSFAGALPWCILFTWLGVKMQNNWELIQQKFHSFDILILILIILGIGWHTWRHLKNKHE